MSTIKSSAENLTLNADGSGNDVIIQSNGSTKVTVDGQNSRVGIGTTTPQNKVHIATGDSANDNYRTGADTPLIVEGTTASYIQFVADANAPMGMLMADASDSAVGGVTYDANGGGIRIKSGGSTRMEVATAGDVTVSSGDIVFATAGKGICLGVTSNTDSNTLDDYEEGTWTPNVVSNGGSITAVSTSGIYTKIGNIVHVGARLVFSNYGSASGGLNITNLPVTPTVNSAVLGHNESTGNYNDGGFVSTNGYMYNYVTWANNTYVFSATYRA
jgi:hypothetical protein